MVALNNTFSKLESPPPDRIQKVAEMVDDLHEPEAREDEEDPAAAQAALKEIGDDIIGKTIPWTTVVAELNAIHGITPEERPSLPS